MCLLLDLRTCHGPDGHGLTPLLCPSPTHFFLPNNASDVLYILFWVFFEELFLSLSLFCFWCHSSERSPAPGSLKAALENELGLQVTIGYAWPRVGSDSYVLSRPCFILHLKISYVSWTKCTHDSSKCNSSHCDSVSSQCFFLVFVVVLWFCTHVNTYNTCKHRFGVIPSQPTISH